MVFDGWVGITRIWGFGGEGDGDMGS